MRRDAGLSLIEICIALIVVGLLMIPIIYEYNQQVIDAKRETTRTNVTAIKSALQQYFFATNRFPCPADLTLNISSATYGQEQDPLGGCAGAGVTVSNAVAKGGVPFAELKIPVGETIDGWGNKLDYIVTVLDTSTTNPVVPNNGAISVNYYTNPPPAVGQGTPPYCTQTTTDTQVPFIIVSYGDDGLGGYNPNGVANGACPAAGAAFENINCNGGNVFWQDVCKRSTANNAQYDDDLIENISYLTNLDNVLWAYSPPTGTTPAFTNMFSNDYIGVGVYTGNGVFPAWPLDVVGSVLAATSASSPGHADGLNFCDPTGANCFPASIIGGTGMGSAPVNSPTAPPSPNCPTGSAMSGIAGQNGANPGYALCSAGIFTTTSHGCPVGQYMTGISPGGGITCAQ